MTTLDLIIRSGTVIDGTAAPPRVADVAVHDGTIVAVGRIDDTAHREVDATDRLVVPGFVDIHTHYDGQATWDAELAPSSWHGVTTAVMGNCGVGFAPVREPDRDRLIELMEGVEDIPGTALHEGLPWEWESFADYLDFLDRRPRDIDLGAQLPHGPVRLYVMGERGARREPATADDVAQMAAIAAGAIEAGALGFTTSRTRNHRSSTGELTPSLTADVEELAGIAEGLRRAGAGVVQAVADFVHLEEEFGVLRQVAQRSGRPLSISIAQAHHDPDGWRVLLDAIQGAIDEGVVMRGQVGARAVGLIMGFDGTLNPFMEAPLWKELRDLPRRDRFARLCQPEVRDALLAQLAVNESNPVLGSRMVDKFELMYPFEEPPNYEPDPATSLGAVAARTGQDPARLAFDTMMADEGRGLLYLPVLNFIAGNLDVVRDQLSHPASIAGLSDGGAHVGTICDVSFPTTLLQWWGRDRPRGTLPLELLVHKQTQATATALGLLDRGVLAPGHRADINVIDFEQLRVHRPEFVADLPAGGRRLVQKASGYEHTFVAGVEIRANGESTGARPGRLVRGARRRPPEWRTAAIG